MREQRYCSYLRALIAGCRRIGFLKSRTIYTAKNVTRLLFDFLIVRLFLS